MTRYATSFMVEVVAFVSHYPMNPKGNVIWYGELLYTCRKLISEFACFVYFMDEIVTRKNLWVGLNSKSDMKRRCLICSLSY